MGRARTLYLGISTVSIAWMTPLLAGTSGFTTVASLILNVFATDRNLNAAALHGAEVLHHLQVGRAHVAGQHMILQDLGELATPTKTALSLAGETLATLAVGVWLMPKRARQPS